MFGRRNRRRACGPGEAKVYKECLYYLVFRGNKGESSVFSLVREETFHYTLYLLIFPLSATTLTLTLPLLWRGAYTNDYVCGNATPDRNASGHSFSEGGATGAGSEPLIRWSNSVHAFEVRS